MADAGAADMGIKKTHTKNGIIGMHATAADSMCQDGTRAELVRGNAAGTTTRRHTNGGIMSRMCRQVGGPAGSESTRSTCQYPARSMAPDWQVRGVVIIILTFYVKTNVNVAIIIMTFYVRKRMIAPRNPPLIIVCKIGTTR